MCKPLNWALKTLFQKTSISCWSLVIYILPTSSWQWPLGTKITSTPELYSRTRLKLCFEIQLSLVSSTSPPPLSNLILHVKKVKPRVTCPSAQNGKLQNLELSDLPREKKKLKKNAQTLPLYTWLIQLSQPVPLFISLCFPSFHLKPLYLRKLWI
jgi:hypothetical protein